VRDGCAVPRRMLRSKPLAVPTGMLFPIYPVCPLFSIEGAYNESPKAQTKLTL
jgi:hypothetical protein